MKTRGAYRNPMESFSQGFGGGLSGGFNSATQQIQAALMADMAAKRQSDMLTQKMLEQATTQDVLSRTGTLAEHQNALDALVGPGAAGYQADLPAMQGASDAMQSPVTIPAAGMTTDTGAPATKPYEGPAAMQAPLGDTQMERAKAFAYLTSAPIRPKPSAASGKQITGTELYEKAVRLTEPTISRMFTGIENLAGPERTTREEAQRVMYAKTLATNWLSLWQGAYPSRHPTAEEVNAGLQYNPDAAAVAMSMVSKMPKAPAPVTPAGKAAPVKTRVGFRSGV